MSEVREQLSQLGDYIKSAASQVQNAYDDPTPLEGEHLLDLLGDIQGDLDDAKKLIAELEKRALAGMP